jgi:hypothetical protein
MAKAENRQFHALGEKALITFKLKYVAGKERDIGNKSRQICHLRARICCSAARSAIFGIKTRGSSSCLSMDLQVICTTPLSYLTDKEIMHGILLLLSKNKLKARLVGMV